MQKMLVIGDGDSAFVKDFITQYHKRGVLVDLISYGKENNNEVRIQKKFHVQLDLSFSSMKNFYEFRTKIIDKIDSDYDVIVIHFIYFFLAPYIFQLKHKTKRIVSVVWGSDFYRVTSTVKKFLQDIIYKNSDIIVFTNPKTKDLFAKKKSYIHTQLAVARFGLPVLDKIDNLKNYEKAQLCSSFNVPENKIKVAVGYNASLAHQQELIANQVVKFDNDILDKIYLVFPMGYGNKENKQLIENILKENTNVKYIILDKFYNFDEVAKLRKITDILINIQPTDQFSGSMQETLYAGGWVLTGTWLPYEKIMELSPKMILIERKEEVGEKLVKLINTNATNSSDNTKNIRAFIRNESSWEKNLPIWDKIVFKD